MFPQDRKYFRFPFQCFAVAFVASLLVSPSQTSSVPKGCKEVALSAKNSMTQSITIDLKLVSNIIDCIKELHRLYKTTDWKAIWSMVPQEVRDVIRNVPDLGKKALVDAKRDKGLCFVSVYLLYRAVDLYDQAMSLEMDYNMHRKEFEWLQMELQPVIDLIHNDLLPKWEYLGTTILRKITTEVMVKLKHFHTELRQLVRAIHLDMTKGRSVKNWAAVFGFSSFPLFVTSVIVGNVPGGVALGTAVVASFASYAAMANTIWKLESLQNDMETMCNEIQEYRTLLEQKLTFVTFLETFEFLIFLSVFLLFVWSQRINNQERDEYGRDETISNGTSTVTEATNGNKTSTGTETTNGNGTNTGTGTGRVQAGTDPTKSNRTISNGTRTGTETINRNRTILNGTRTG